MARCAACNGAGSVTVQTICAKCSGTGELITYDADGSEHMELCGNCEFGLTYTEETCRSCNGRGEVWPFEHTPFGKNRV
jgi:RecJ-like exonuclease